MKYFAIIIRDVVVRSPPRRDLHAAPARIDRNRDWPQTTVRGPGDHGDRAELRT